MYSIPRVFSSFTALSKKASQLFLKFLFLFSWVEYILVMGLINIFSFSSFLNRLQQRRNETVLKLMGWLVLFPHTKRYSWQDEYYLYLLLQSICKIKFTRKKKTRLLFGPRLRSFTNVQQSMSSLACWG